MYCIQGDERKENKTPKCEMANISTQHFSHIIFFQDNEFVASENEQIKQRHCKTGEGDCYTKRAGVCRRKLLKTTPKRQWEPALREWLELSSPQSRSETNSVKLLRLRNTLRGIKTAL